MFIKEHGAAAILLAIVFMSLGFLLGKAKSPWQSQGMPMRTYYYSWLR